MTERTTTIILDVFGFAVTAVFGYCWFLNVA